MTKMDPVWKKKWIEALRSGKYSQGRHTLKNSYDMEYCCLGVLCDIVDPYGWTDNDNHYDEVNYPANSVLNKVVLDRDEAHDLAVMNDAGEPFSKIAAYIEDNY